jgi:hypothetical protein
MKRMMLKTRPKGMSYKAYHKAITGKNPAFATMEKAAFEGLPEGESADLTDNAEEGEDESDETSGKGTMGGGDDDAGKADVTVPDLLKALADYDATEQALAKAGGGASRESYLKARLDATTITKSERVELGRLWAGDDGGEPVRKSLTEAVTDADEGAKEMVDASPFLKGLVDGIDGRIEDVTSTVVQDGRATRELLKAQGGLIKGLVQHVAMQDGVIKALSEKLGVVAKQPAVRKSVGSDPRDVREPRGGGGDPAGKLTKGQVDRALMDLVKAADAVGDTTAVDRLVNATARFETDGHIAPNIYAAVKQHLGVVN